MPAMPCPHARYHWSICPWCNDTNDIKREQPQLEEPAVDYGIVKEDEGPPATTITEIEI